jgi:hypothetical protein
MYSGGGSTFGSNWLELNHLDRLLAQLTRPTLAGSEVTSPWRRKELVQRMWGRKRPLLRGLEDDDDGSNPIPPCA